MKRVIYSEEHDLFRNAFRSFVEREVVPNQARWREDGMVDRETWRKAGEAGFLCPWMEEEHGGAGGDFLHSAVIMEELARVYESGFAMSLHSDIVTPYIHEFGNAEQKKKWLPGCASGEIITAVAMTEPGTGSDLAGIATTARKDGDDYVITGTKMWITNGMKADWCCLLANTSDDQPHKNKSLIAVPMDAKGITRQKIRKIGMNSSDTAQLFFDDVRVPRRNLIGQEGMGFTMQMLQFQEERLYSAASSLKGFDRLIDLTIDYTSERKTFGKPILDNQVVHFRLAELRTEVEALRALTWSAVEQYVAGGDVTRLASMAKLKTGRLAREITDTCLQYWGGQGYTFDNPVSRAYRDTRLVSIGAGADEIMLGIIAKLEGTLPGTGNRRRSETAH